MQVRFVNQENPFGSANAWSRRLVRALQLKNEKKTQTKQTNAEHKTLAIDSTKSLFCLPLSAGFTGDGA